jgi:hypothetical protein
MNRESDFSGLRRLNKEHTTNKGFLFALTHRLLAVGNKFNSFGHQN